MKPGAGHAKGAAFERDICRQLSLWWTSNERDDIFWRTPQSGGRATSRSQKSKSTAGHYGDIMAVDPIGNPLLKFMTFELKHGYANSSIMDLLDGGTKSLWAKWIAGAQRVQSESQSIIWALIVRRHSKKTVICVPDHVVIPFFSTSVVLNTEGCDTIAVALLDDFLVKCNPAALKRFVGACDD